MQLVLFFSNHCCHRFILSLIDFQNLNNLKQENRKAKCKPVYLHYLAKCMHFEIMNMCGRGLVWIVLKDYIKEFELHWQENVS